LALNASGTPVCSFNRFISELDGVADLGTSQSNTTIRMSTKVYLGISQSRPCPTCEGDGPVLNDGVLDGTCNGGARDGLACDANGKHPTFGPVSYSCLPEDNQNISGSGLSITLGLTDGAVSLPFGTTCDAPFGAYPCACAVCSGDTTLPCNLDAECAAVGAGTCSSKGSGASRAPNSCSDGICGSDGQCAAGPDDNYCDGLIRANGLGIITCQTDADCDALSSECPGGDCGSCNLSSRRSCFTDPITLSGSATQNGADLVSTFCVPPGSNSGVNLAAGTPGPGALTTNFTFTGECADGTAMNAPGGSNCN
jgi:hypothetical protein